MALERAPRRLRRRAVWALAFAALAAVRPAAAAEEPVARYALLIGVGSYDQWPSLVNPIPDLRALAAELAGRYGFLPEILENPGRSEILGQLRRYAALAYGPEDQLVIAFAGHGTYDEVGAIGYLAARDSASRQRDPNFESLIPYPWLLALIDGIPCRHILLVVDACYSGSLSESDPAAGGPPPAELRDRGRLKTRRFLTSGGKEYVTDGDPDRHTPFMGKLLAGLRSQKAGDRLTLEQLFARFMSQIEPRPRWGRFGSDRSGGEFFLLAREGPPAGVPAATAAAPPPAAVPVLAPDPPSGLRSQPSAVAERELKRSFLQRGLYEAAWHPEGDFPNQFRVQTRGLWDVVMDLASGLMWQQAGSGDRMSRAAADSYIAELNRSQHAGHGDWRLPTLEELGSLLEPGRQSQGLYVDAFYFDPEQETCWSADRDGESGEPYFVSFNIGRAVLAYGEKTAFVRAVRSH